MLGLITSLIENYGLLGIFIGTFLSYSILPLPSDAAILVAANYFSPYSIFIAALLGSTLGSLLNYFIGLKGIREFFIKKQSRKEKRAEQLFRKWGPISLILFGWLPFLGDPLVVIAGTLKMKFSKFLIYSTLGKIWFFIILVWFGYNLEFII